MQEPRPPASYADRHRYDPINRTSLTAVGVVGVAVGIAITVCGVWALCASARQDAGGGVFFLLVTGVVWTWFSWAGCRR